MNGDILIFTLLATALVVSFGFGVPFWSALLVCVLLLGAVLVGAEWWWVDE